jgi:hypothetical protein
LEHDVNVLAQESLFVFPSDVGSQVINVFREPDEAPCPFRKHLTIGNLHFYGADFIDFRPVSFAMSTFQ